MQFIYFPSFFQDDDSDDEYYTDSDDESDDETTPSLAMPSSSSTPSARMLQKTISTRFRVNYDFGEEDYEDEDEEEEVGDKRVVDHRRKLFFSTHILIPLPSLLLFPPLFTPKLEEELTEEQKDIKNYHKEFDEMISWLHRALDQHNKKQARRLCETMEKRDKPLRAKYSNHPDAKELIDSLNGVLTRYYRVCSGIKNGLTNGFLSHKYFASFLHHRRSKELLDPSNFPPNQPAKKEQKMEKMKMMKKKTVKKIVITAIMIVTKRRK